MNKKYKMFFYHVINSYIKSVSYNTCWEEYIGDIFSLLNQIDDEENEATQEEFEFRNYVYQLFEEQNFPVNSSFKDDDAKKFFDDKNNLYQLSLKINEKMIKLNENQIDFEYFIIIFNIAISDGEHECLLDEFYNLNPNSKDIFGLYGVCHYILERLSEEDLEYLLEEIIDSYFDQLNKEVYYIYLVGEFLLMFNDYIDLDSFLIDKRSKLNSEDQINDLQNLINKLILHHPEIILKFQ